MTAWNASGKLAAQDVVVHDLVVAVADRTSSPYSRFAAAESDLVDALRRWLQLDD